MIAFLLEEKKSVSLFKKYFCQFPTEEILLNEVFALLFQGKRKNLESLQEIFSISPFLPLSETVMRFCLKEKKNFIKRTRNTTNTRKLTSS